jgi:hypothetical protein
LRLPIFFAASRGGLHRRLEKPALGDRRPAPALANPPQKTSAMRPSEPFAFPRRLVCAICLVATAGIFAGCGKNPGPANSTPPGSNAQPAGQQPQPATEAPPAAKAEKQAVKADFHNVLFRLTPNGAALLENVSGELWPVGKYDVPVFDDKTSFELRIANGTISITPAALAAILNEHVFAATDAPLKEISLEIRDERLIVKGKLHSKKDLPFETAGELMISDDGRLRVRTEKVKALHLPVKKVMELFGIEFASVLNTSKIAGLDTDKNDLLLDLNALLPPPHIRGKIATARLGKNAITVVYGDGGRKIASPVDAGNYIYLRENRVRFGKLAMENTDLALIDLDPQDPLDWNQSRYEQQLAAGYTKVTERFGLRSFVKDFAKLPRATRNTP